MTLSSFWEQVRQIAADWCNFFLWILHGIWAEHNYEKSSIYLSPNTPISLVNTIYSILNISASDDPGKYLGLPSIWGKLKQDALFYTMDMVLSKMHGWKANTLSMVVREVVLKSVALAILYYFLLQIPHLYLQLHQWRSREVLVG